MTKKYKSKVIHRMPIEGQWRTIPEALLQEWEDGSEQERGQAEDLRHLLADYDKNKLKYFMPHGDAGDFLSDRESDICFLLAPNQTGKSYAGTVWTLLRLMPTDPGWPIFQNNGIEWREWEGPKTFVVASYSWENVSVLWEHYKDLCPRAELGAYAPSWGRYDGETGKQKALTFGDGKPKTLTLACGSQIKFQCYTQPQHAWEGSRSDGLHGDEQMPKEKFIGWIRSTTTRGDQTQCCFTLTGHVVEGRPDTGAAGWLKREMWDGNATMGLKVGRYRIGIENVPDAIITRDKKEELRQRWVVEPERTNDQRMLNEAKARYWGDWEPGGGLVLSNFNRDIHVIPTFEVPRDWTRYRGLDHGRTRPFACAWAAVTPWGDLVFYREYYAAGLTPATNAKRVVELCGNRRKKVDEMYDEDSGASWPIFEEEFTKEFYYSSVMDGRSFGTKSERNCTLGQLYNQSGLFCTAASGQHDELLIPHVMQWLESEQNRENIMVRLRGLNLIPEETYQAWLKRVDGRTVGAPRMYVMDSLRNWIMEAESWANMDSGKPEDKHNHLMDATKYIIAESPRYFGDASWAAGAGGGSYEDEVEPTGYKFCGG